MRSYFQTRCFTNSRRSCAILACKHSCGLTESLVFDSINLLRQSSEIVTLDPLVTAPIRDVNDIIVMQTAIIGEADILCTKDDDFFEEPASEYLRKIGIAVLDDIS